MEKINKNIYKNSHPEKEMFNKKTCSKCGRKTGKDHNFCHSCGSMLNSKENKQEWGMIGKNDLEGRPPQNIPGLFGGISGKIIDKMINSTMKMLEKEMQNNTRNMNPNPNINSNFELYINGKRVSPDKIKVTNHMSKEIPEIQTSQNKFFSTEKTKTFANLPKDEPKTNLRRLSDKIIYEIELPGVKSVEDISIVKLENSIEIKALSKERAYSKTVPFDLKISKYNLSKEKLILELSE